VSGEREREREVAGGGQKSEGITEQLPVWRHTQKTMAGRTTKNTRNNKQPTLAQKNKSINKYLFADTCQLSFLLGPTRGLFLLISFSCN